MQQKRDEAADDEPTAVHLDQSVRRDEDAEGVRRPPAPQLRSRGDLRERERTVGPDDRGKNALPGVAAEQADEVQAK